MPVITNPKRERFAQELAKGLDQAAAYRKAGYTGDKTAACRAAKLPAVVARVEELQARAAKRAEVTVADIARQLDQDRAFARKKGQASAAVSATLGKAKVLGLVVERQEHTGRNGGPIEYRNLDEDEIDARLDALARKHAESEPDRPLAH